MRKPVSRRRFGGTAIGGRQCAWRTLRGVRGSMNTPSRDPFIAETRLAFWSTAMGHKTDRSDGSLRYLSFRALPKLVPRLRPRAPSFHGEFDPGSGRTLAACLTHASRARKHLRV